MVKRKYQQEYDIAPPITFSDDHVALDISDDGAKTENGWEILPVQRTNVSLKHYYYSLIFYVSLCLKWGGLLEISSVMAINLTNMMCNCW